MAGLPPSPGEVRSLLGAAVPALRQSHEAEGSRAVVSELAARVESKDSLVLTGRGDRPRQDQHQMAGLRLFTVPRKPRGG